MRVLAISGTYRPKGTTARLTEKALEGAASESAETQMILLCEKDIQYCTNCLTCYKDTESEIGPCPIRDDMRGILEAIRDADGVIFSSPVHCGFVSGVMVAFIERATWTLLKPTAEMMGLQGCPEPRLADKARATATLVSAGGMPTELRQYCDQGTPWLQEMAMCLCNGTCIGDMYAGAFYPRELEDAEWPKAYLFRELTDAQFQEAFDLGATVARAIKEGRVEPLDMSKYQQDPTAEPQG